MPGVRLDANQKSLIKQQASEGLKAEEIARQHGVSVYTVYRIARGDRPVARRSTSAAGRGATTAGHTPRVTVSLSMGVKGRAIQALQNELDAAEKDTAAIRAALHSLGG